MVISEESFNDFYNSDLFNEIYKKYYDKLFYYVFNIVRDEDDTFDVIQDIFINLEKKLKMFNDTYALSTFLYKIAYNAAVTKYRKNIIMSKIFWFNNHEDHDYNLNYAVMPVDMEQKDKINTLMGSISNQEKSIIYFKYFENMSSKEIAGILNIKSSYVDVLHSRILKKLKGEVKDESTAIVY